MSNDLGKSRLSGIPYQHFINGMVKRGYNPELVAADGYSEEGYWEFTDDRPEDGTPRPKVFKPWNNPEDYVFIHDNYPGVGGWTYE